MKKKLKRILNSVLTDRISKLENALTDWEIRQSKSVELRTLKKELKDCKYALEEINKA